MFGDYHVLAAVGVDAEGRKHVLGVCGGASENMEVTVGLLEALMARGVRPETVRPPCPMRTFAEGGPVDLRLLAGQGGPCGGRRRGQIRGAGAARGGGPG